MVIEIATAGAAGWFLYWAVRRGLSPVVRRIRATPRFTVATVPDVTQYYEGIVEPYQRIAIAGYGQRDGERLVMRSSPHLPLAITNAKRLAR